MAKIPSIALIPSGVKATKVYSQLPVDGNGDFTFDRGTATSVQTRVNKDGLIEDVAQDVPRLDYLDGGCPSLLLEPATTNLLTYSEDFNDPSWSKLNATVNANASISPKGDLNADKIIWDNVAGFHLVSQTTNYTSSSLYTQSYFVKSNGLQYIQIYNAGNAFVPINNRFANFDILNGILEVSTFTDAGIDSYGNGWYRIWATEEAQATDTGVLGLSGIESPSDGYRHNFTGDGTSGIYIWGAQLEQQSYATSYVPSLAGVQGQRAAETCNGAGTTAEINSQEGVLYAEIRAIGQGEDRQISISDNSVSDRVSLQYNATTNLFVGFVISGSVIQETFSTTLIDSEVYSKFALKYSNGDCKLYINGLEVASGNTFTTMANALSELEFDRGNGASPFYGRVKRLSVYNSALNDSQLESLTGFGSFAEMKSYLSYS